jgi:putative PIN family toxin of toxin-antitoxin system
VRLVLDTNVYISAILFDGLPELPVRLARANRITLLTSEPIIAELIGVLRSKLAWPEQQLRDVEKELRTLASVIRTKSEMTVISDDDADNRVLECAVDGRADLIISGDRHLLKLGPFAGIRILSPRAFAELLGIRE